MNLQFLSKDYPVEKSFFIVSKFCLSWMGQFPRTSSSIKQNINSGLHLVILFAGVISQFWYGFYYVKEDLQRGLDAICPAISCMVSFVKMALICWYGKDLSVVIMHLEKMLFTEKNQKRNTMVSNLSATATNLAFMVLASGVIANIFYGLRPILTNVIRVMIGKEYLFDETHLRVMVPAISLTLPWYPFTYALIFYMGNVTVFAFSGVDGIFISFCLYTTALLKLLQNDMKMSLEQCDSHTCWKELKQIIDRHNEVVNLVTNFTAIFKWIILSHFVTSSLVIGASIIESMLYPGYRALVYLTYTAAVSCELFIYCYGGSAVLEKSSGLGLSAYVSNWPSYDLKVQKMILMIIIRSQKPLTMAVPFFTPSLETFTSVICRSRYFWRRQGFRIIRTAGSIIAVVKSVL